MVLAFFGHQIEDKDVLDAFKVTKSEKRSLSLWGKINMFSIVFKNLFFGPMNLIRDKNKYMDEIKYNIVKNIRGGKNSKEIFDLLMRDYENNSTIGFKNHAPVSMGSSIKNMMLRSALEGAKG